MKRIIAIFCILIYGITAIGSTVYVHYCMNKLQAVSLHYVQKDRCDKCGMKSGKTNGCCKDVTIPLKTDKEHQVTSAGNFQINTLFYTPAICTTVCCICYCNKIVDTPSNYYSDNPLPDNPIPIYKFNCNYRV